MPDTTGPTSDSTAATTEISTNASVTVTPSKPASCPCWGCWFQGQTDKIWLLIVLAMFLGTTVHLRAERDMMSWGQNLSFSVLGALLTLITQRQPTQTGDHPVVVEKRGA